MTTFTRRGFVRRSKHGVEHWVRGTEVTRDDWWRNPGRSSNTVARRLMELEVSDKVASAYIVPNATCPVCGDRVYFYRNEFGSRVYFDDLGPPWPKHPCTDSAAYTERSRKRTSVLEPTIRPEDEIENIQWLLTRHTSDFTRPFVATYKSKPWPAYRVDWCKRRGPMALLVLRALTSPLSRRLFLRISGFRRRSPVGSLVFYSRNRLSYFAPVRTRVVEVDAYRLRGAKEFVEALLEFHSDGA
jgi:hypothetical protein